MQFSYLNSDQQMGHLVKTQPDLHLSAPLQIVRTATTLSEPTLTANHELHSKIQWRLNDLVNSK